MERLSTQQILDAQLDDWRQLAQALHARFRIADFTAGAAFVAAVAQAAEAAQHHPDISMSYGFVDLSLCSHDHGRSVTSKDIDMARTISAIARDHALDSVPSAVTQIEIALDTANEDGVAPFWAVLLTGSPDAKDGDTIFDPGGQVPNLWFQRTDDHPTPRQRWHFDLWLAPEIADERIAAALKAGGTIVDEGHAPAFTILADSDGNKVCVCTCLERD